MNDYKNSQDVPVNNMSIQCDILQENNETEDQGNIFDNSHVCIWRETYYQSCLHYRKVITNLEQKLKLAEECWIEV